MGWHTKDGDAFIDAVRVVRINCSKCGIVSTSRYPMNDREVEEAIRAHARDKHGGINRG